MRTSRQKCDQVDENLFHIDSPPVSKPRAGGESMRNKNCEQASKCDVRTSSQKCDQVDENIASKHSKNNKNKYNENNFRCGFFDNKGE